MRGSQDVPAAATSDARGREVLDAGFRVLRALPGADVRRQTSSLAELTSIPRSTVHRLLRQLRRSGAVEQGKDGRWTLSPQLLELAGRAHPLDGARTQTNKVLQILRAQTGATVSLVAPTGTALVAVEMIPGHEPLPIDAYAGIEMPGGSAAGLVLAPGRQRSPRIRPHAAAVDDQHLIEGLTCYARRLSLPGGYVASLQIATTAKRAAENFAAHVQRAGREIETLARRASGADSASGYASGYASTEWPRAGRPETGAHIMEP